MTSSADGGRCHDASQTSDEKFLHVQDSSLIIDRRTPHKTRPQRQPSQRLMSAYGIKQPSAQVNLSLRSFLLVALSGPSLRDPLESAHDPKRTPLLPRENFSF